MAQRRNLSKAFKAKVAIEAIKGEKTINEIAGIYGVHPNQISRWKKQALQRLPEVMADSRTTANRRDKDVNEARLHQKIGQMAVEIDFLKKKLLQLGLASE